MKKLLQLCVLSFLLFFMRAQLAAQTAPPVGTWSTIPNTAIFPAMPPEMSTCPASTPNCRPELWSPASLFAYSGGDLYRQSGVWGFLVWGGGHSATPDNSLYWSPFDGSGPKRLTGPYLAPDRVYGEVTPLETYRSVSRNQPGLTADCSIEGKCAPKSRHTYASLLTLDVKGTPTLFNYGGSLSVGSGSGTAATRTFDLTQTYAQAMARLDMGWVRKADAPSGSVTSSSVWDPTKRRVVTRGSRKLMVYYPDSDKWEDHTPNGYNGCCDYPANTAIDVVGRKMYVLGDRIAERYDLDTFALTNLAATTTWGKIVSTPAWQGGYGEGPGVAWHERTKQILFVSRKVDAATGSSLPPDLLLINPAAGSVQKITMPTMPNAPQDFPFYGRLRIIPGTDQVVVMRTVTDPVVIGTIPF
jgi:hypothetical protein